MGFRILTADFVVRLLLVTSLVLVYIENPIVGMAMLSLMALLTVAKSRQQPCLATSV